MKKTGKKILAILLTCALVIGLSVATTIIINKKAAVPVATVKDGLSAYEIAVSAGYNGSLQEWLNSLNGKSAYQIAKEAGFNGTEQEFGLLLDRLATSEIVSLKTAYFNGDGELILTLSDDTTINAGRAVGINGKDGADGRDGRDGIGITNATVNESGELVLLFSDNKYVNVGKVVGATGIAGKDGLSAYQIAVITGATTAETEAEWIKTLKGDTGAQGIQGEKGDKGDTGAQGIQGEKGDKGDTGAQGIQGEKGDKGDTGAQGMQGEKGDKGDTGANGKSAYEIAKDNGCTLSENEWLDSLKGLNGSNGMSAYDIAKQAGLTTCTTEAEWIESLKGDTGAQGIQGEKGDKGDTGANGKSAYELAIQNGIISSMVSETQWLNSLKGEKGDKGDTGATGEAGVGIRNIALENGSMTITLTDSSTYTFENINGKDGVSPQIRINSSTNKWEISSDNGATWTSTDVNATGAQGMQGEKGDKGDTGAQGMQGEKGADGVTPKTRINPLTNEWEISVNNGLSWDTTGVKATGAQGIQGEKGDKGDTGAQGIQGEKGDAGISVIGVSLNDDNKLVITFSEGEPVILDKSLMGAAGVNGKDGTDGQDGRGVSSVTFTEDFCLVFNYSDGTTSQKLGPIKGEKGDKGDKGDAGTDGIGITTVYVDERGNLYITYSNSSISTLLGNVKGPKGDKGDPGSAGQNGVDGKSAFELYQQAHPEYTGTYAEWVDSLKGEKGDPGRGIASMLFNDDNELIVTYTDGTTQNLGTIPFTSDVLNYTLLPDNTYGVYAGNGAAKVAVIDIPSLYKGRKVTQIMADGFKDLSMLQQINIPNTITTIGQSAFKNCVSLNNVRIPAGVKNLDDYAFFSCSSLSEITLVEGTETIGLYCFSNCTKLKTITLPDSLTTIKAYSFYGSGIEEVNMNGIPGTNWTMVIPQKALVGVSGNRSKEIEAIFNWGGNYKNDYYNENFRWSWLVKSVGHNSLEYFSAEEYSARIAVALKEQIEMSYFTREDIFVSGHYSLRCDIEGTIRAKFYQTDWIKE